jgi:hypothetical protein
MLKNGYWPLLNDCKRPTGKGWPTRIVGEAEVRSWDRSALTSTGLKVDGDLAVIDVDISEAASSKPWQAPSMSAFPSCLRTA